jgi:hypothetical protein
MMGYAKWQLKFFNRLKGGGACNIIFEKIKSSPPCLLGRLKSFNLHPMVGMIFSHQKNSVAI